MLRRRIDLTRALIRVVIVAALWAVIAVAPRSAPAEITLGILPRLGPVDLYEMFTPLAEYLGRETGEKVSLVIPRDFDAFKMMVNANLVDLGFCNSLIYVQLKKERDIDPLAVASEPKAGTNVRGIIIARRDSGIKTVRDLKGKKLVFVERDSAAGHIFQMLTLSKVGLDIHKDIVTLPFAKKHDNVIMAVFNKAADAGGIREDDLEKMKGRVDVSKLKIVSYTDYYPNWPLFSTPRLKEETAARIRAALLKLKPNTPQVRTVLGRAVLTGFAPVSDRDYDQLREAARLVGAF
jgi:phosphonate transport system substrate-binding protein